MDCNPQDDFQRSTPMIKLVSSDGDIFEVEVKVAQLSLLLKKILDDLGIEETDVISIPQNAPEISGTILGKIIQWANHHKDDLATAEDDENKVKSTIDIGSWDAKFLQVDQRTLTQMIRAANYLDIKGLLDVTCKKVAKMMKGMTLEEVRSTFHIQNDFSPDEEEQVCQENAWIEGIRIGPQVRPVNDHSTDQNLSDSVQDVDNGDGQFTEDCLNNALVVRKIFGHLSDLELVFSRLNKKWNYEARSFMRQQRIIIANLDCHSSCQVAKAFAADLQQMNTVPFCGMRIVLPNGKKSCQCGISALDPTDDVVFDPLPFKTLSLQLPGKQGSLGCPLVKQIMRDLCGVLEELTLLVPFGAKLLMPNYFEECSFPGLKILKLEDENPHHLTRPDYVEYFKALISRAPNLRELHSNRPIRMLLDLVEGSTIVPVCSYEVCAPFNEISVDVINSALRLQRMSLVWAGSRSFNFGKFSRIAPMLLQAPCTSTLRDLTMDAVLAVPLMSYGIRMDSLRKLSMVMYYDEFESVEHDRLLRLVASFDFTRIFPNLIQVHITMEGIPRDLPGNLNRFIMQASANFKEPKPDRAVNIQELHLDDLAIDDTSAPFFAKMFPNIERLYVEDFRGDADFIFEKVCQNWDTLTELHIKSKKVLEDSANFDGAFCGIHSDEVRQLMRKDDAYLKSVNIVPVKPSIACFRNLRVLNVEYPVVDDATNPRFFLSKITGLIVLERCPNLAMTLKISPDGAQAVQVIVGLAETFGNRVMVHKTYQIVRSFLERRPRQYEITVEGGSEIIPRWPDDELLNLNVNYRVV